jgi:hypothetical protein
VINCHERLDEVDTDINNLISLITDASQLYSEFKYAKQTQLEAIYQSEDNIIHLQHSEDAVLEGKISKMLERHLDLLSTYESLSKDCIKNKSRLTDTPTSNLKVNASDFEVYFASMMEKLKKEKSMVLEGKTKLEEEAEDMSRQKQAAVIITTMLDAQSQNVETLVQKTNAAIWMLIAEYDKKAKEIVDFVKDFKAR